MSDPKRPSQFDKGPPGKKTGRASVERAEALRDVMSHAVEVEKDLRKKSGPPGGGGTRRAIAIFLSVPALAFCVYSFIARPEFIWGANRNSMTEVRRDANARFTLYLLSRRLESYKKTNGRYPTVLSDVLQGLPADSVRYALVSEQVFELRAPDGNKELVFRSDQPVDQFLGRSPTIVSGRGPE